LAQRIEQQEKQDVDLNDFVKGLAGMTPSISIVTELADANLGETVTAMLNLIEDASLFILNYKSRSTWGGCYPIDYEPRADKLRDIQREHCIL
jgi:hypothetical protein